MVCVCGKKQLGFGLCMTVGLILVIVFAALPTIVNKKIEDAILMGTIITNPGEGLTEKQYNDWISPVVEIDYYLWNITNLKDVLLTGAKPVVRETGPFGYSKTKTKYNVTFFDTDDGITGLVSYNEATSFVPILEGTPMSNSSATFMDGSKAIITSINVPYLVGISGTALPQLPNEKTGGNGSDGNSGTEGQLHLGVGLTVATTATHGVVLNDSNPSSFLALFRAGSISNMLNVVMGTVAAMNASLASTFARDFALGDGFFLNDNTCGGVCLSYESRVCMISSFANASGPYYRCVYADAILTGQVQLAPYANRTDISFQGLFELHRPVPVLAASQILLNASAEEASWSLRDLKTSLWGVTCGELATGNTSGHFPQCVGKFMTVGGDQNTCIAVCQWIGALSSRVGDTNNYTNPTQATKYRWMVNFILQKATHALNTGNTPNVYQVPWMNSWEEFAALQFSRCTIMRIVNGITPYGEADDLSMADRFATSLSSNAPATAMGLGMEPCAQTFKLCPSYATPYRWRPTLAESVVYLGLMNDVFSVLFYFIKPIADAAELSDAGLVKLMQVTDFLVYMGRYFALLPRVISSIVLNGFAVPWDPVTGVPLWNEYGTGRGYVPSSGPFNPATPFYGGGSGLFTTRYAQEFLFGYQSGDALVSATGAATFSSGLQGPNMTSVPADNSTARPKTTIYTGSDGDKTHITFYHNYYGMEKITNVNDFYDSNVLSNRYCVPGAIRRYSFAFDCTVWNSTEDIKGLSDGFKAPYTFNEDGEALDMNVWVSEGWRAVNFRKTEDITFKDIKMWKYTMDPRALMNLTDATASGDAVAIANAHKHFMTNHPSGVASRQRADGLDFFVSLPHYLGGNTSFYREQLDIDLRPSEETHASYLSVDPLSGRTMSGRKRLQLGVFLSKRRLTDSMFSGIYAKLIDNYAGNSGQQDNFPVTGYPISTPPGQGSHRRNLYIPIFWASEGKDISDSDASDFVTKIYGTRKTFKALQIALVLIGGVTFLGFLVLCLMAAKAGAGTTGSAV